MKSVRSARLVILMVVAIFFVNFLSAALPWVGGTTVGATDHGAPILVSPENGVSYRSEELPKDQVWTGVPGAISYTYESYSAHPDSGTATVVDTAVIPVLTSRTIPPSTPEGDYWWRVKATTVEGETPWSEVRLFSVDDTLPTSASDLPALVGRTATILQTVTDAHPKEGRLSFWKLHADGTQDNSWWFETPIYSVDEAGQISYSINTQATLRGDGEYVAKFNAWDKAGNASVTEQRFELDTTAPTIVIDPIAETASGSAVTIGGTVSEQVGQVFVTVDSVDYLATLLDGAWTVTFETDDLVAGEYDVRVTAMDLAGNLGSAESTLIIGEVQGDTDTGTDTGTDVVGTDLPQLPPITTKQLIAATTPIITNPAATVRRVPTEPPDIPETTEEVALDQDVSSLSTVAAAMNDDATDGNFWGVAWYWWLLIVGGGAAAVGWLIALIRRGGSGV